MVYVLLTAGIFLLDLGLKRRMDRKYAEKVRHPRLQGVLTIEKYYNDGVTLGFLAKTPRLVKGIHMGIMAVLGVLYFLLMRMSGKRLCKTGMAMLFGGGLSNLYDRCTKGHVIDYFHINVGPKWFRNIIFNVSDLFIFLGTLLAALGSEEI